MKPIDIIVFVFAVSIVGYFTYKIIHQRILDKRNGTVTFNCASGCSGCSGCDDDRFKEIRQKGKEYKEKTHAV